MGNRIFVLVSEPKYTMNFPEEVVVVHVSQAHLTIASIVYKEDQKFNSARNILVSVVKIVKRELAIKMWECH